eukprot:3855307-Prymnesium_polylepis.1
MQQTCRVDFSVPPSINNQLDVFGADNAPGAGGGALGAGGGRLRPEPDATTSPAESRTSDRPAEHRSKNLEDRARSAPKAEETGDDAAPGDAPLRHKHGHKDASSPTTAAVGAG